MTAPESAGAAQRVDVLVIGAGQAGLSAAYHLRRRGFVPAGPAGGSAPDAPPEFVVLDAEQAPGGAWQHRWATLQMGTVNGIYELPGEPVPTADPEASSREVLPAYFAGYEQRFGLNVHRPVTVSAVRRGDDDLHSPLIVESTGGIWAASYVINATGTWTHPYWPYYPGRDQFAGRQLHVHDYVSADEFAGQRVVIVGAGVSALQLLDEISAVTDTFWVTRREPVWEDAPSSRHLADAVVGVAQRTEQGLPGTSVTRATGMFRSPWVLRAQARGALVRHPMFTRIERDGVRMPDGSLEPADVILWATGFHPAVSHLAPLRLRTRQGGIRVRDGRALDEPRLFLIGYGPSQSTVGANRAGRDAAVAIVAERRAPGRRR